MALVLAGLELGARGIEWSRPEKAAVPAFVELESPLSFQKLFADYAAETDFPGELNKQIAHLEREGQVFPAAKPPGQTRVVVMGGSQAAGVGLSVTAAYSSHLERFLCTRHPQRDIRVYNVAKTGYASPQLAAVAERLFPELQPDLVVTVFGHNERLDVKALAAAGSAPPRALAARRGVYRRFALARLLDAFILPGPNTGQPEAKPLPPLNEEEAWRDYYLNRLRRSLVRISNAAEKAGARLVVCFPPANLAFVDVREWWWAPDVRTDQRLVKARYWLRYGPAERAVELLQDYAAQYPGPASELLLGMAYRQSGQADDAKSHFRRAIVLAAADAQLQPEEFFWINLQANLGLGEMEQAGGLVRGFQTEQNRVQKRKGVVGLALQAVGRKKEAREILIQARDEDRLAIRATTQIGRELKSFAARRHLPFFDLDQALSEACPDEICGWDMFFDYCHLNPLGQIRLAGLLLDIVEKQLGIDGGDNPAPALEGEWIQSIQGRTRDFATHDRWLGVCDSMWRISDEQLGSDPCQAETDMQDPTELCWAGNYHLFGRLSQKRLQHAIELYQKALLIDPGFLPAERNLEYVRGRFGEAVFP